MAIIEIKIPQMGEGIVEATIIKWHVKVGDRVKVDDVICEIATDKVDSEITSPDDGEVKEILFREGDVVQVGKCIVKIQTNKEEQTIFSNQSDNISFNSVASNRNDKVQKKEQIFSSETKHTSSLFLSPLVKQIVKQHQLSTDEILQIKGTGIDGRITKNDVLDYIQARSLRTTNSKNEEQNTALLNSITVSSGDTIIEMDRIRKLIAEHMVRSKHVSAHVTSFVETDVTHIVQWREKIKNSFFQKYGIKLTYLPVFVQALTKSLLKFPLLNATVDGDKIILKKSINIGIATALPDDNLIVPVLKDADQLNLLGIIKGINDLATRARESKLQPSEIMGGTFSVTNLGTFGTMAGTPIINQPQVAILGIGTIRKIPSVIETKEGDMIGIRNKVILSLSYDHRIIDGMLAGKFLKHYIEQINTVSLEDI